MVIQDENGWLGANGKYYGSWEAAEDSIALEMGKEAPSARRHREEAERWKKQEERQKRKEEELRAHGLAELVLPIDEAEGGFPTGGKR